MEEWYQGNKQPWTHDHKMQCEKVVNSKLGMYHGDRNLSKNNIQPH